MKSFYLVAALLVVASSPSYAFDHDAAKKAIESLYKAQDEAYKKLDPEKSFHMKSNNYVRDLAGGTMKISRDEELDFNRKFLHPAKKVDWWTTKIESWEYGENTVTVHTTRDFQIVIPPQYKVRNILKAYDVFSSTSDGWKLIHSHELESKDYNPK